MRVLFISHYPGLGGANLSMIHLIEHLRIYGVVPLVFIPAHGPVELELQKRGIAYEIHWYASLRTVDKDTVYNALEAVLRVAINIGQSIRLSIKLRNKIDVIHSNSSLVFLGWFFKKIMRKPLIWHLREFGHGDYDLCFPLGRKISAKCYEDADVMVAISQSVAGYYMQSICPGANMRTIYNGIDESSILPRFIRKEDKVAICMAGGISEQKNQIELIRAVRLIKNNNFRIDIIGDGDKKYIDELSSIIKEYGLDNTIKFIGPKDNIGAILKNYSIGIITSKNEAFGRVIIEYMLAKLAVIAPNAGACTELVSNGQTGFVYELGNTSDLANKLQLLIQNDLERNRVALSGYDMAINHYTARINAQKVYMLYKEVLKV